MTTARRVQQEIDSYLSRTESLVIPDETDLSRLFYLRPSSFPYCGLKFFLDFQSRLNDPRLATLASSYFTSVGTATHSVFQAYTAPLGKIVGDWLCRSCGRETKFSTFEVCKCGAYPEYQELELRYKNTVVGHTDALYRFTPKLGAKSVHAVMDYKTTSSKKVAEDKLAEAKHKRRVFPYRSNVAQIESYVPLLESQYNVSVDYWALIYLARDAPFKYGRRIVVKYLDEEAKESLRAKLLKSIKVHRRVLQAQTLEDLKVITKHKLCSSLTDFNTNWKDEHNPCPHCKICFEPKALNKQLKAVLKLEHVPLVSQAPAEIKKGLKL